MNYQEAFDKALTGIRAQGGPSMRGTLCMYRSDDGRKCGVGHLIPDEAYTWGMEGKKASEIPIARAAGADDTAYAFYKDRCFLEELQNAHDFAAQYADGTGAYDGIAFFVRFEPRMQQLARKHNLNYTEPQP